jgi:hypothetical protein
MLSFFTADISGTVLRNGTPCLNHHNLPSYSYIISSLQTYGAKVDQIKAEIGAAVSQSDIEKALVSKKYKILTFTHVDTSTGAPSTLLPPTHKRKAYLSRFVRRKGHHRHSQTRFSRYTCTRTTQAPPLDSYAKSLSDHHGRRMFRCKRRHPHGCLGD